MAVLEFPGGPVVRTRHFHCRGWGSIPGWGTKIPHAGDAAKKIKQKKTVMAFPVSGIQNPFFSLVLP